MTELKTPTAVLHEGPRSLSEDETAEIERRDLQEIRQVDIDDVIEYVQGLTVTSEMFLSPAWVDAVWAVLEAGPDEETRAGKLPEYWDFYHQIRAGYESSWALGVRNLPAELGGGVRYLVVAWGDDHVVECRLIDGSGPVDATYVLAADYQDWKALHQGYDALRTVMYRKLLLEDGDLLEFFKAIYFFVECLAIIAKVPTRFPEAADVVAASGQL